jgi:integrase
MTLRLFGSDGEARPVALAPQLSAHSTISQTLEWLVIPDRERKGRSPETIAEYRLHVRTWGEFCLAQIETGAWNDSQETPGGAAPAKYRMSNPVLIQVRRRQLLEFQQWLLARGLSARNVNKHVQTITMVLREAARYELIGGAPELEALPTKKAADKLYLTTAQVGSLYEAAEVATWPPIAPPRRRWPAADYWRALFVLFWNYGQRTQELVRYERRMDVLTWGQVSWEEETPSQAGTATNSHGWFYYTPQKQRWAKDDPLVLPLNEMAAAHLRSILPEAIDPAAPIFDFPCSADGFYQQWAAIRDAAQVKPKKNLKTGLQPEYLPRHFRKSAVTYLNLHKPGIAPLITGHASRREGDDDPLGAGFGSGCGSKVAADHYDNQELRIVEALLSSPQPPAFERIYQQRQRILFQ